MKPPELEYLFSYSADIDQPQQGVGAGPFGHRMIARVMGGRVEGPRLNGKVLPGGGDWALIDGHDTLRLDARITLETDDGALIFASYRGVITPIDPETVVKVISGTIEPGAFYYRTTPSFERSLKSRPERSGCASRADWSIASWAMWKASPVVCHCSSSLWPSCFTSVTPIC